MINRKVKASRSLPPQQRRRLIGFTLILAGALLALLVISVSAASDLPLVPGLATSLAGSTSVYPTASSAEATPQPSATPVRVWDWLWWQNSTNLAEEPGPTSTPKFYAVYLPEIIWAEPTGRAQADLLPEPPPVPPTPNWPNGLDQLTNSKLGVHVVQNNDPFIMEFIRRTRPRVVKAVGDLGWLSDVKLVSPNTVTIGRIAEQNEDWVLTMSPEEAADLYIASQIERYRLNPGADFWEGWNEFVPVNHDRLGWYARFEARRACAMQALGFRAAVGGFSVGVPEYADMAVFMPALEAAYNCGGIFHLHEYNSPTMDCGVTTGQTGAIPGAPNFGSVPVGYHTLRYRFWYEGYLKPRGMGDLPLVISEAGVEGRPNAGGPCNDPGGRAWKSYADWWVQQGYGPSGPEAYVNLLAWYDDQMRQDAYVIGATLFTAGAPFNEGWTHFDLHDVFVPLAWYAVALQ
jgi:hypothetical protein